MDSSDPTGLWQMLALDDSALEQADVVTLDLAVAKQIPSLSKLDVSRYVRIVDGWAAQFAQRLPDMERTFKATPWKWKSDIGFFRVGMLQGFLGHEIGLNYIEEQKQATGVRYTNPSDLFVNGLIDTGKGTCGSMPTLHVAIARKLGWPVSLACAKSHLFSRFADGPVSHNVEATSTHPGAFCSEEDSFYIKKYNLPKRAVDCGSDLRKLTAREMAGVFLALAGRHFRDVGQFPAADGAYALSRVLFPRYRCAYIGAMLPMLRQGDGLFNPDELGHPLSLFEDFAPSFAAAVSQRSGAAARPAPEAAVGFSFSNQMVSAPQDSGDGTAF